MRKLLVINVVFLFFFGCISEKKSEVKKQEILTENSDIASFDYEELKPLLNKKDNKTYVVNFWATWCAPCVKELPAFEKLNSEYENKNVSVLLVSLDFPKQIDKKLKPFIKKRNIQSKVVVLDDDNEQFWINDIDKDWSGALPATIIYNKNKRKFYEQSFDYKTLKNELQIFLN